MSEFERAAEQFDQIDLASAVVGAPNRAIGLRIDRVVDRVGALAERPDHRAVEIFRQRVEFDGVGDGHEAGFGQSLRHEGDDPPDVVDVLAQIVRAVEVVQEERRRIMETLAGEQVGVGARESCGLPCPEAQPAAAKRFVLDRPLAKLGRTVEFA